MRTPGPWRLKPFANGYDICVDGVSGEARGGWFIELHSGLSDRDSSEIRAEFEANSHLIAAAPDLLAALKTATDKLERCIVLSGSDPEFAAIAVSDMRKAIAKAEPA